jgi:hypothetical protein
MNITINCIEAEVPTQNGRIYSKEALEKMRDLLNKKIKSKNAFIYKNCDKRLSSIIGLVTECKIENNKIVVDANFNGLKTLSGDVFEIDKFDKEKIQLFPMTIGSLENNKVRVDNVEGFLLEATK